MSESKEESSEDVKALSLREDWPLVPYLTIILIGLSITLYDFIVWQQFAFQFNIQVIIGIMFMILAGVVRTLPRRRLSAAGFGSIWNTPRLKIAKGHKLVTDGYYKHIRHPIIYWRDIQSLLSSAYPLQFLWVFDNDRWNCTPSI